MLEAVESVRLRASLVTKPQSPLPIPPPKRSPNLLKRKSVNAKVYIIKAQTFRECQKADVADLCKKKDSTFNTLSDAQPLAQNGPVSGVWLAHCGSNSFIASKTANCDKALWGFWMSVRDAK
ncbi:hypothetical protein KIN20_035401 [Parelaphostrongylus tenuis]|uniref:Uncharacterized protein n=1 Tax=Parelaphostrongylus tenuis TaxID=148309 RepID=A0AAD5WKH4_PARTN|nr:hypothetical protein KIN20_035401 [Parelaphostrongylus tenuis]